MSKNDLSMAYSVRGGVGELRSSVLRRIIDGLDRAETPRGLSITWKWRNTPAQDMREADFETAIAESRPSFVMLMRRRLERDLDRALAAEREAAQAIGGAAGARIERAIEGEHRDGDALGDDRDHDDRGPGRSAGGRRRRAGSGGRRAKVAKSAPRSRARPKARTRTKSKTGRKKGGRR